MEKSRKLNDVFSNSPDGSTFEIIRQVNNDMEISSNPIFTLNKIIPPSIKEYFFFDGEQLNNYFSEHSGKKINEAVFKISQLILFEDIITHLENRRSHYRKELNKVSPKAGELGQKLEILRKKFKVL